MRGPDLRVLERGASSLLGVKTDALRVPGGPPRSPALSALFGAPHLWDSANGGNADSAAERAYSAM